MIEAQEIAAVANILNDGYFVIASDDENNADEWWCEARKAFPHLANALSRNYRVIVSGDVYELLAKLPGFADGPEYAKTALRRVGNWLDTDQFFDGPRNRAAFIFAEAY